MNATGQGLRYRAYLSYSHKDEAWARWLHRSLERYRVPGRLSERAGTPLHKRLAPVFRDRDDLATAADLTEHLREALSQSEALIVLCSPASANSRWVTEEIRTYREMHPERKILCMIVEGDPEASVDDGGCFPVALFEGMPKGREPMAADARSFADGKKLARQKIIAGLLGVGLDDVRQRDRERQRRLQLVASLGVIAALWMGFTTWSARQAEGAKRAQAEQLASFIVELGQDLEDELDLDSLERISRVALGYLDQMDASSLTPETRVEVALVLRQLGEVNLYQGSPEESLGYQQRSFEILDQLYARYPEDNDIVFHLAQAEFYLGNHYYETGDVDRTLHHWDRYLDIAENRHQSDPGDALWLLEYSYASSNLVNFQIQEASFLGRDIVAQKAANIALAKQALDAWDGDMEVMAHYGNELAFLADAQQGICALEASRKTRVEALEVAKQLAAADPSSNLLAEDVAYREAGLATVLRDLGDTTLSETHRLAAIEHFTELSRRDPSNLVLEFELARSRRQLGFILGLRGDVVAAREQLDLAQPVLEQLALREGASEIPLLEYLRLLEDRAFLALEAGLEDEARANLDEFARVRSAFLERPGSRPLGAKLSTLWRYLWWRLDGVDPATFDPSLVDDLPAADRPDRGCDDADTLARHGHITGDFALRDAQVAYLLERGYGEPDFILFCRREGACGP